MFEICIHYTLFVMKIMNVLTSTFNRTMVGTKLRK